MEKELPPGYELRGAEAGEAGQVLDYLEGVMGAAREYFACVYRNFPGNVPSHSRVVLHAGRIVAHVHLFPIDFHMNGVRVPGMMIGDVSTHPEHRRRGLGTLLLEDACRHGREHHGATFGFLKSGVAHFYGPAGWDVLPMRCFTVDVPAFDVRAEAARHDPALAGAMERYAVRRFERAEETDRVAHVHEEQNRGRSLTVVRDGAYWRRHFYWSSHHEVESLFLVAETGGEVVAYSRANDARLMEMGCLAGHAPAALALLESTLRQLRRRGVQKFDVLVPEDSGVWSLLAGSAHVESAEFRRHWLRQIDWPAMFARFEPAFAERIRRAAAAPSRPVTLSLGGRRVTLPRAFAAEAAPQPPTCDLELSQLDAFRLVTGTVRGASLTRDPALAALLDTLFPPDAPIFWPMDVV